jgi:hypothetical protein
MKKMKDGSDTEGFHVDVISGSDNGKLTQDMITIRINVDDFEEACELLKARGYIERPSFGTLGTKSSKYAYFRSPTGTYISICHHIKDHD